MPYIVDALQISKDLEWLATFRRVCLAESYNTIITATVCIDSIGLLSTLDLAQSSTLDAILGMFKCMPVYTDTLWTPSELLAYLVTLTSHLRSLSSLCTLNEVYKYTALHLASALRSPPLDAPLEPDPHPGPPKPAAQILCTISLRPGRS